MSIVVASVDDLPPYTRHVLGYVLVYDYSAVQGAIRLAQPEQADQTGILATVFTQNTDPYQLYEPYVAGPRRPKSATIAHLERRSNVECPTDGVELTFGPDESYDVSSQVEVPVRRL
ncbi:hypothetical protein [Haloglomus salinum]|uniref:hypothetical protein n=1 Tax=Haloglomus salinum TaxID=2962673 RepID=UPI0020CA2646|nr:hypothetical protein [Haloglomus salinum]